MNRLSQYLIFTFLIISQSFLLAQNNAIKFDHLSIEQGLSQSVVLDILQDKTGFLWIATQEGLNRYDGFNFKIYKHNPADSTSISDNWINSMCLDKDIIWIGTEYGGLNKFYINEQKFERINIDSLPAIRTVCKDREGVIWFATWGKGLYSYDSRTKKVKSFKQIPGNINSISNNKIRSLYIDKNNVIWVGTGLGLDKLNKYTGEIKHYYHNEKDSKSISDNFIVSFYTDNYNRFWIGTAKGLNLFDPSNETFIQIKNKLDDPFSISDDYITVCFQDADGNLLFGTYSGGINKLLNSKNRIMKSSDARFINYKIDVNNPSSLSCNYVRKIFQDRSNVIWIGTWGGGLNKFDAKPGKFITVKPIVNNTNSLSSPYVRSFYKHKSGITFIGTDGDGLDIFSPAKNRFYNYKFNPSDQLVSNYNFIYSFYEDEDGNIWIATFKGILKLPKEKINSYDKLNLAELTVKNLDLAYLRSIKKYDKDFLLLGAYSGLAYLNKNTFKMNYFKVPKAGNKPIPPSSVTCISKDDNGSFWIGMTNGLLKIDVKRFSDDSLIIEHLDYYKNDPKNLKSISSNKVDYIHVSKSGTVWVGTNLGLNRFNKKTNDFTYFMTPQGMPNDVVNGILEDNSGNLWISTNKGVSRIIIKNDKLIFRNYDAADGLQSNEFNQAACYKSGDGEFYFGGINGYSHFYPEKVKDNPFIPQIAITNIKIWNKEINKDRFDHKTKHLQISYHENFLSFEFAAFDFTNPQKNRYQYTMEGFDKFWINSGNQNFASYTNLDPGNYVFKIRASNNDGIWNREGAYIYLTVTPPYWMTWWFRLLVVSIIAAVTFFIYKSRIARILELERLRTKIASDLHDEVGSSLTKISMNAGLIELDTNVEKMRPRLHKIEEISREIISTMSDIVWSIDSRNDSLGDLIDRMRDFTYDILMEKQIDVKFDTVGLDIHKKIPIDLRQNIYMIFKEAVNNAAKHSQASNMKIKLINSDRSFTMIIQDDGCGFPGDNKPKGNGIKNIRMRAERIKGKIEFISCDGLKIILKTRAL